MLLLGMIGHHVNHPVNHPVNSHDRSSCKYDDWRRPSARHIKCSWEPTIYVNQQVTY